MTSEQLIFERPWLGVARFTLNRPDRKNALTPELRESLIDGLSSAIFDNTIKAIILTGANGNFCAGGDLERLATLAPEATADLLQRGHHLIRLIVQSPKPVLAAVEGVAAGGGTGLALACDQVVMGRSSRVVLPFFKIGLVPDWGIAWTLTQRVGPARARNLLLNATSIDAKLAEQWAIADHVVADENVQDQCLTLAKKLAEVSTSAIAGVKQLLSASAVSLDQVFEIEKQVQPICLASHEFRDGVAAFFQRRSG
jgi:2-(1,2-epoxy-1,2-dihydrophenyl)acetyl-CoA isomerase